MKPTMQVVKLKQRMMILAGSNEEMSQDLHEEEVDCAW